MHYQVKERRCFIFGYCTYNNVQSISHLFLNKDKTLASLTPKDLLYFCAAFSRANLPSSRHSPLPLSEIGILVLNYGTMIRSRFAKWLWAPNGQLKNQRRHNADFKTDRELVLMVSWYLLFVQSLSFSLSMDVGVGFVHVIPHVKKVLKQVIKNRH